MDHPTPETFYDFILEFFGNKASDATLRSSTGQVGCTLYESFVLSCNFDQHGGFHASVALSDLVWTDRFFGKRVPMGADIASAKARLSIIDNWCRLRLPDKFLEVFDVMEREEW